MPVDVPFDAADFMYSTMQLRRRIYLSPGISAKASG